VPAAPLPSDLVAFLREPHEAVVGTVRADGAPVTTACWYALQADGRILLTMDRDSYRLRHLRGDPRVALTVLADDWYSQLSVMGRAVELRDDPQLADIDAISQHYLGEPYEDRAYDGVSVLVEVERWHTWGDPARESRKPETQDGGTSPPSRLGGN
jgi:PPOX class probable F420-dependent enzyme